MEKRKSNQLDTQVTVARMYYRENLSQEEIAKLLHVSRPTITRILKTCLENGIVTITVKELSSALRAKEERLAYTFGLRKAIIVPSDENYLVCQDRVGAETAAHLRHVLPQTGTVGLSWGTTLNRILYHAEGIQDKRADVMQVLGDPYTGSASNAAYMTVSLANALGGRAYVLPAPMLVENVLLHEMLLQESYMRELYKKFEQLDVILLGFGATANARHFYMTQGESIRKLFEEVKSRGAVCDFCGTFLDANGNRLTSPLDRQTFCIPFKQLEKIPELVGVACGIQKKEAALAALRSGLLHTFIMDEVLADAVLPE